MPGCCCACSIRSRRGGRSNYYYCYCNCNFVTLPFRMMIATVTDAVGWWVVRVVGLLKSRRWQRMEFAVDEVGLLIVGSCCRCVWYRLCGLTNRWKNVERMMLRQKRKFERRPAEGSEGRYRRGVFESNGLSLAAGNGCTAPIATGPRASASAYQPNQPLLSVKCLPT